MELYLTALKGLITQSGLVGLTTGNIIMLVVAVLLWVILKYTRIGFELRAVGYNRHAAEFSAMPVRRNSLLSMFIAGGVAGAGGYAPGGGGKIERIEAMTYAFFVCLRGNRGPY